MQPGPIIAQFWQRTLWEERCSVGGACERVLPLVVHAGMSPGSQNDGGVEQSRPGNADPRFRPPPGSIGYPGVGKFGPPNPNRWATRKTGQRRLRCST